MKIKNARINNFRLLKNIDLSFNDKSTVIVGRNNSGKTSLTEIFRRFFSESNSQKFKLEDFSISAIEKFRKALTNKSADEGEDTIRDLFPKIELQLLVDYDDNKFDYGVLSEFIIDLEEENTEAIINISYQLKDGKIKAFFYDLDDPKNPEFLNIIRERIVKLYTTEITAIDPTDNTNIIKVDHSKLLELIGVDFINAQRGLDDVTQSERDVLGKVLSSIFKNASNENASEDMKQKSKSLNEEVDKIQNFIDTDLKEKLDEFLPTLSMFGYPGLSDPNLTTKTTFNAETIVESNTKILYKKSEGITLPETYNGLGSRNLIFILFKLFEYFRKYQSNPILVKNHLIFIEEPEAHLHPQMQEVFISKLYSIAETFSNDLNKGVKWPVQFVVSTHSTHIANEADFDTIRYFLTKNDGILAETEIKDLKEAFKTEEDNDDKDFIYKYLTLTKSDLFFSDKAILIEGATERILMPSFIKKIDSELEKKLSSQYLTILEVGGAYAHHFYKFLDFLNLKTLIITDLDAIDTNNNRTACLVSKGNETSNTGLKKWFSDLQEPVSDGDDSILSQIQLKTFEEKELEARRISYQIPEGEHGPCGRSFEDAFMITNKALFGITQNEKSAIEKEAYEQAEKLKNKKANFALEYALEKTDWNIPLYIKEGLTWLSKNVLTNQTTEENDN
ncbi:ATP-dependent endonuclease [Tenacibaculum sp. Bg11-29]|uniref:ATP-dependent nuclease n=1 Tax=Tenacibaculum sp. Bg11-29 TaxID=2058306 RepID=UPI000C33DC22|nr:AAA family ATPase [Tenacibaculum sp. Bg11-29]PKH51817.1 ATP-dependent endonuclease [Tenacibaculum sp. Bg11-29]